MNLLKETLSKLEQNGKTIKDVHWVGSSDGKYSMPWDKFVTIAGVDYDSGYGGAEIATELVVVGDNWWLSRGEYDGSEWWDFNTIPIQEYDFLDFNSVRSIR